MMRASLQWIYTTLLPLIYMDLSLELAAES
jgi:hypothetical protein